MLTGNKRKIMKEVISYVTETTGLSEDMFILLIQRNRGKAKHLMNYNDWLAVEAYSLLESQGISLSDCLSYRTMSKQSKGSRQGVYLSSLWKKEIASEIEKEITNRTILVELSDLIDSEFNYISAKRPYIALCDEKDQKFNFLNTFDFGEGNKYFLDGLPKELKEAIENNSEIIININPYIDQKSDVQYLVEEMKLYGYYNRVLNNPYYHNLFRLIRLKEDYNLSNLKIGIYGPIEMFKEEDKFQDFYKYFKKSFLFKRGICFNPKSIGVRTRDNLIGYTVWESNNKGGSHGVVLKERVQHTEETILQGTTRLMRGQGMSLYTWSDRGQKSTNGEDVPVLLNINTFGEEKAKRSEKTLGYLLSSQNLLRMLKRVGVTNLPMGEYQEITSNNFWQMIASYVVRSCLEDKIGLETIFLSAPDVTIEGYMNWLADALILFLFDTTSMVVSYREQGLRVENMLFPMRQQEVKRFIKDKNILRDIDETIFGNEYILDRLSEVEKSLSMEAMSLYIFGKAKIKESLMGGLREENGYKNNLLAWDSSLYQIRTLEEVFTPKEEEKYNYLVRQLKNKLYDGVYTYGFITSVN